MQTVRAAGALVALALATVAAGCGGGGASETDRAAVSTQEAVASMESAQTTPGEAPATEVEVAWAGRVIDWAIVVGSAVEFVEANRGALGEGKVPPPVRRPLAQALRALADCGPAAEEVGRAPSERLGTIESALGTACERFATGARSALDLLVGARGDAQSLAAEWEQEWGEGEELMRSVAEGLREFQPANTRTLPERAGVSRASRVEPEFGAVASELVETDVEVRCWSRRDWTVLLGEMERFTRGRIREGTVGFAGYGDHRVNLAPPICDGLVALRYAGARPRSGEPLALIAVAVETLMHEAQHIRGVWNEPGAECYGMQMLRDAARALGAPSPYAARLADVYWTELYKLLPPTYRSDECRDGGKLDADPESSVWP